MIYAIIIISLLLFIFMPHDMMISLGVTVDNYYRAFGYVFLHASWLHLILNSACAIMLWVAIKRMYIMRYNENPTWIPVIAYLAAVLSGIACASTIPTVGMSGVVYFLLGVLLLLNPTKKQAINYLYIVAACVIQWYFGKTNVPLHILSFIEGALFVCVREFLYQYKNSTGLFEPIENADTGPIYTD